MATIKVRLTNRGEDSETPWAEDLGPVGLDARRVRLINVPFLHAKPTWGDEIIVLPGEDGFPTWDRNGVPWKRIHTRIVADGGRWAMIVDYRGDGFLALAEACHAGGIICEGAWGPRGDDPGRAYLAVPTAVDDVQVMTHLRAAELPCELIQIHPEPPKPRATKRAAKKPAATKRAAKKPAAQRAATKPAPKKRPNRRAAPAKPPARKSTKRRRK